MDALLRSLRERILVLDGGMGTSLQRFDLSERDYRGTEFAEHTVPLRGNHDVLCLTRPDAIASVHDGFLEAGSDILETCSFCSTSVGQRDYELSHAAFEMSLAAARVARRVADEWTARTPEKQRWVAGSMGPTGVSLSLCATGQVVPAASVTFDELKDAYRLQACALIEGGVDLLLIETVFDSLNAKAAILACEEARAEMGLTSEELPLMISVTLNDSGGRTLAGQTMEAFWISVFHARPLAIGINCSLGARELGPHVRELSRLAATIDAFTCVYPNAGLPNAFGEYEEAPEETALLIGQLAKRGLVNMVGGCCGVTFDHIRSISSSVAQIPPRRLPSTSVRGPLLAGLEPLFTESGSLVLAAEKCSVTGSRRFASLIERGDYESAIDIARRQIDGGASVLDVSMDGGLLDAKDAMERFLAVIGRDHKVARVPLLIDSSDWNVIEAAVKRVQGKPIVSSISLRDGEEAFLDLASKVRRYGCAVLVMAADEIGQAESAERKVSILERSFLLLTEREGFDPTDIYLDPGLMAVATGIPAHDTFGRAFIEATRELSKRCRGAMIVGGTSNISFAFRGNETVRRAIGSVFLHHAKEAGLTVAIADPMQISRLDEITPELLEVTEDLVLGRGDDASTRLLSLAGRLRRQGSEPKEREQDTWRDLPLEARIEHSLANGLALHLETDMASALEKYGDAMAVIEGPLLGSMRSIGDLFSRGELYLPQVVRSAQLLKLCVEALMGPLGDGAQSLPTAGGELFDQEKKLSRVLPGRRGRALLATVRGDVHDIGKNIVSVVLECSGLEIIDLGVMVPPERIIEAARKENPTLIGLSALITPSLHEMVLCAKALDLAGVRAPLLIGGATTSGPHTASAIAPNYAGPTIYVSDASKAAAVAGILLDPSRREAFLEENRADQARVREIQATRPRQRLLSIEEARERPARVPLNSIWTTKQPSHLPKTIDDPPLSEISAHISWQSVLHSWDIRGRLSSVLQDDKKGEAARDILRSSKEMLHRILEERLLVARARYSFFPASSEGDDVVVWTDTSRSAERARLRMLRQQRDPGDNGVCSCLSDFVAPIATGHPDWIGGFVLTTGIGLEELADRASTVHDEYGDVLIQVLADRLAEAFAGWLHCLVTTELAGSDGALGIRPAYGLPACPDHSERAVLHELLAAHEIGVELTSSLAMTPRSSISGLFILNPAATYFDLGRIGWDQATDYASRKGLSLDAVERLLGRAQSGDALY